MQNNYLAGKVLCEFSGGSQFMGNAIGCILREWRKQRRYSQLQLSLESGISAKHISFLETGRSIPSKEMILKIGEFLFLPKREINRALYATGYAPIYRELPTEHEDLQPVFNAIEKMIANHMPYPALVINQNWDIIKVNNAAKNLLTSLGYSKHKNLIEALISDNRETSKIINWHEQVSIILMRLRYEISRLNGSKRLEALAKDLSACLAPTDQVINIDAEPSILPIRFQVANSVLSFFSIISQLSSIQDVAVSELKVELMFPADEATIKFYSPV